MNCAFSLESQSGSQQQLASQVPSVRSHRQFSAVTLTTVFVGSVGTSSQSIPYVEGSFKPADSVVGRVAACASAPVASRAQTNTPASNDARRPAFVRSDAVFVIS